MGSVEILFAVGVGYLVGAIPFGVLVARSRGVNILTHGSGNIGATNVGRVLGRQFGALVFFLDFAKGALPVAAARWFAPTSPEAVAPEILGVAAGMAAFLGHLFPLYLGFRGGKGVATAAGVVAVLVPVPAAVALLAWLTVVAATRYVSLASLAAAACLCLARSLAVPSPANAGQQCLTAFCYVAAILVFLRHHSNLKRLFQGTENRLRDTSTMLLLSKILHLAALSLWFGSAAFFSLVVAPLVFQTFERLAQTPLAERSWLPLPESLDKEGASRLAGAVVGPIFPWFFLMQGVCGFVVVITALGWSVAEPNHVVHRLRSYLALAALTTIVVGWPLARHVGTLRMARYADDPTLRDAARSAFASWHLASLLLSFVTLLLVAVLVGLAAQLPTAAPQPTETAESTAARNAEAEHP